LHSSPRAFLASFPPEGIGCAIEMPTKFHEAKSNTPPEEVTHKHKKQAVRCYASPHDLPARQKVYVDFIASTGKKRGGRAACPFFGSQTLRLSVGRAVGVCASERTRIALLGAKAKARCQSRRTEIHCCHCTKSRRKSQLESSAAEKKLWLASQSTRLQAQCTNNVVSNKSCMVFTHNGRILLLACNATGWQ
jgi:hypothetical protein